MSYINSCLKVFITIILGTIILCSLPSSVLCAERHVIVQDDTLREKMLDFVLDKLFETELNFSYNLSSEVVKKSLEEINDARQFDKQYLQELQDSLSRNPKSAVFLNNLGNYYQNVNEMDKAISYFEKALSCISVDDFEGDSVMFLAIRATLKFNLGPEGVSEDLEKALSIDPNNKYALVLYVTDLLGRGEFEMAELRCIQALKSNPDNPELPFVYLITVKLFEQLPRLMEEVEADEQQRSEYLSKNFSELFDFSAIDSYARQYSENQRVKNARHLADIMALYCKLPLFEIGADNRIVLNYTKADTDKLLELEKWLIKSEKKKTLNKYSCVENLGFVYFLLGRNQESIEEFNKAISIFPIEKRKKEFNQVEAYNGLIANYFILKDTLNLGLSIQRKIDQQPMGRDEPGDYQLLASHLLKTGKPDLAKDAAVKCLELDPANSTSYRVLAHSNYLKGLSSMAMFYAKKADAVSINTYQKFSVFLQYSVYQVLDGNYEAAEQNLTLVREADANEHFLKLCDQIEEFIHKKRR